MELGVKDAINLASTDPTVWSRLLEIGIIAGLIYGVYVSIRAYTNIIDERHKTNEMRLNKLEDTLVNEKDEKERCLDELRETTHELKALNIKIEKCWEARNG